MQMCLLLLSLALRGLSHALLAPVVVYPTHGLSRSAPWTSVSNTNRYWEENAASAFCAWAPLTSSALCAGSQCLAHKVTNDMCLTCACVRPCAPGSEVERGCMPANTRAIWHHRSCGRVCS